MNSARLKWLMMATAGLVLLMVVVNLADRSDTVASGELLLPDLKDRLNGITEIRITSSANEDSVTVSKKGEQWLVEQKDGFPADVGKLREVLLALADAKKLEQKTSNPERYSQLGVGGPDADSGVLLEISGDGLEKALIIGNAAQSSNRYVRLADDEQSWLIDKNPDLPDGSSGWLAADLLDVDASRVQSVSITHRNGETIRLSKAAREDADFAVENIPDGRELTYATVANGIAGTLKGLRLDDVRRSDAGELTTTSVFRTFDGLELTLRRFQDGEASWFSVSAAYQAPPTADTGAEAAETSADEVAIEVPTNDPSDDTGPADAIAREAETINDRHAGWQYRIADYKANLLARRWDDILKEKE